MRKALSLVVLVVLGAVLGWLGWERWGTLGAAEATLAGRYRTEEQWLAGEIVQDVVEICAYAAGTPMADGSLDLSLDPLPGAPSPGLRVGLTLPNRPRLQHDIVWQEHVWSPETYRDLVVAVRAAVGRPAEATAPSPSEDVLGRLLTPLAKVIETENQRVSQGLHASPLAADTHEEAALLLGALALREASGDFWDVRSLLCRMAAHLAVARSSTDSPGVPGRYAQMVLSRLSGRTAEALAQVEAIEAGGTRSPTQDAWLRALRLSITDDTRPVAEPDKGSLLERLQYYRAVRSTVRDSRATEFQESSGPEPAPDWGRVALAGSFGLAVGGFVQEGVEPELAEAREIWQAVHGRPLADAELTDALNRAPGRCITPDGPRVIDWGTWAASIQRHMCHRITETDAFVRRVLGQHGQGMTVNESFDSRWSNLTLYPFVQVARWKHGHLDLDRFRMGLITGVKTAARRPELVNPTLWTYMRETSGRAVTRRRMADPKPWFASPAPAGTAYDAARRAETLGTGAEALAALRARDPWSFGLGAAIRGDRRRTATVEGFREIFGPREAYDTRVLRWLADDIDPTSPDRVWVMEGLCRLDADECAHLAELYVAQKRDAEAVQAYRRAFEAASDPLLVANHSSFVVRSLYEGGDQDGATELAEASAQTGSAQGLETMGLLLEWRGDLAGAEGYFDQVNRSYDNPESLLGFCHRAKDKAPGYGPKFTRLAAKIFPKGLEKLDTTTLPPVPTDGIRIYRLSANARSFGLAEGDIIVGVDGWRVRNQNQYTAARALDWRPEFVLSRWQKGRYEDFAVRAADRRLGFSFDNYPNPVIPVEPGR